MAFGNRGELETEIISWLGERTDLIPKVPSFIVLCEEMISGRLRCREQHERALALLNEEYEWLPTNFAAVDHVVAGSGAGDRARLPYRTLQQLDSQGQSHSTSTDMPCAFSIIGNQIRFSPPPTPFVIPDGVDPDLQPGLCRHFEIVYWTKVAPLTAPASYNVVLQQYPSIYLFGSLVAAEPYLVNDPRVQLWASAFNDAIDSANGLDKMGTLTTPQVSLPEYAP
jgi:hypothetical protein